MNKLDAALRTIHQMDAAALETPGLSHLHPLAKLALTIEYLALVLSFPKYDLAGLSAMAVYPVAGFLMSGLSARRSLKRLLPVLPMVLLMSLPEFFFCGSASALGLVAMLTLLLKSLFCVLAACLLAETTPLEQLCYALRQIHVPRLLVTQILLTYRYLTVLIEEASWLTQSYSLRAPFQKGIHFRVWGSLTGQLLLRSIDRANAVYQSMLLRGYRGEFSYVGEGYPLCARDVSYFAGWTGLLFLFRCCPVFIVTGNWIGRLLA